MSVSESSESLPVRGKVGSSMRLPLHSAGDQKRDAFSVFPSSSSSSSFLEEISPGTVQSLSSLSGGRNDSIMDYDMFEVILTMTKMTPNDKTTDVISKLVPKENSGVNDNNDISVGKEKTVLKESNDNSVSVYLDANSGEYCQDTWNNNDKLTLALSLTTNNFSCGDNDDLSSGTKIRHDCSTLDSDATEVPDDDDDDEDDEEEAWFLSLSSDTCLQRNSEALTSFTSQLSIDFMIPGGSAPVTELQTEVTVAVDIDDGKRLELVLEEPEATCPIEIPMDSQTKPPITEDHNKDIQISSSYLSTNPTHDSKEDKSPEYTERCTLGSKPTRPKTSQAARAPAPWTTASTVIKPTSVEAKRVSKLKTVKAKVRSWPIPSPPKTPSQKKSAPANGRKAVPRREEPQTGDEGKSQRSSADPVKVFKVLKPVNGKSSNLRTHLKTAASDSAEPEKKIGAVGQKFSASFSSLGSEVSEEGPVDISRKIVQEVPDQQGKAECVETHLSEDAGEESVDDPTKVVIMTEAAVEKPRTQSRKVSSKLVPNARLQRKSTRLDKASGPALPPGSGAGPPGRGSTGPKQSQIDGSMLEEARQSSGGGSPTKVRQTQSQSQGIPKPRSTTERASALIAGSPTSPVFRPTSHQQPALGSAGQPVVPTLSKLPVKGLPTSLNSSSLGSNENNGATSKASPAPTGTRPDEQPSRSMCPMGSQSVAKPPSSSTTATQGTCSPSDTVISANTAAPKAPVIRTRTLSLQARTMATGLKSPAATNHNTGKTTAASQTAAKAATSANQGLTKQDSQYPLQRSGLGKLSRINSTVDKNKPREAPARPTNTNSSSQAAPAKVNSQNQLHPSTEQVPNLVNTNLPVTAVLPMLVTEVKRLGFKARTGSRSSPKTGCRMQNASKPGVARVAAVEGMAITAKQNLSKQQAEKNNQAINQLRKLLVQGNKRVEALATVIQHLFTECEEALKQKKELSLELAKLQDELVTSSQCCERLQNEREELRLRLGEALKSLAEQHKEELVQLEDRLRSFYQTEWDKVHQTYQEEADKCRMLMKHQVDELRSQQEIERKNLEMSQSQRMKSVKQQYDTSIQELKMIQQTDLENLKKTLTQTETSLSEKISELSAEKESLNEKLQAEEERRRQILTDKNLDSHTVYLEQELESLKVVLEIKNNQLHQKEKKLMEMDKLMETNVKLEECLKRVQQENEDYKARNDKHAALSKQLSNEQAILQQTLQKESKVNKRLSMEKEELLWKLHNGDLLASPRHLLPTSSFNSPRNSASFPTTAPLSPR
ncbi:microtubule-associated tumor suppressor 1 homolog isoform X2 [Paralichthys olivaceus]|uniref:microtubule-associated tumor suppressor 1 homolog isoform X2 n=1 Tax=Paralichthys olivaceus TaxID=8255 RepID=UPI003752A4B8